MDLFESVLKLALPAIEKAANNDISGALRYVDQAIEPLTKRRRVAENLHSLARAPLLHAQGLKVGAAQAITKAARFDVTEPVFQALDSALKQERTACAADFIGKKLLKHRTSLRVGEIVRETREMKPGREGVLGAGVYFAENEAATEKKTRVAAGADGDYAMITATVDLGRCRIVDLGEREWRMICDGGFKPDTLRRQGFDSVGSNFNSGWEYVVFDPKRIQVKRVECRRGAANSSR